MAGHSILIINFCYEILIIFLWQHPVFCSSRCSCFEFLFTCLSIFS